MTRAARWLLGLVLGAIVLSLVVTAVFFGLWSADSGGDDHPVGKVTTISTTR